MKKEVATVAISIAIHVTVVHNAGSFAKRDGLETSDVVRKINGKTVANVAEMLNAMQVIM